MLSDHTIAVPLESTGRPAAVFRLYGPELMRFATGLVGRQDAEDVFSQAMAKVLAAPRFAMVSNPRAYMYRAVFNEANTWRRRMSTRRILEARFTSATTHEDPLPRPEVVRAVLDLSTRQRAAVILTYWADLDPAAVADRLGISEGSVRRHLARARARLRRVLDE